MNIELCMENLRRGNFQTTYWPTKEMAADYLEQQICGKYVGFGDSQTLHAMNIPARLSQNNRVWKHHRFPTFEESTGFEVFLCSANAIAETGEIVNIDGYGNRIANTMIGPKKVYVVAGVNKLTETLEQAVWRARNIASPLNNKRMGRKTPCASGDKGCLDCRSAERICRALLVLFQKPGSIPEFEVVLIGEDLGF